MGGDKPATSGRGIRNNHGDNVLSAEELCEPACEQPGPSESLTTKYNVGVG